MKMIKKQSLLPEDESIRRRYKPGTYPWRRLQSSLSTFDFFTERVKGIGSLAVTDKDDCPTYHIQNNGQITMSFTDRDLINGNHLQIFTMLGKSPYQIPFLHFLDHILGYC